MNAPSPSSAKRLPAGATAAAVYRLLWALRDELLRLGAVPLAISYALSLPIRLWPGDPLASLTVLAQVVPMALFAVAWLRLVLLGPNAVDSGLTLQWGERETRVLIRLVQLLLSVGLAAAIPLALVLPFGGSLMGFLLQAAIFIAAQYLFLRWALVLPAAAVDHPGSFGRSWTATVDCGPQMVAVVLLVNLPILALDFLAWQVGLLDAFPYATLLLEDASSYIGTAGSLTLLAFVFRSRSDWRGLPAQVGA
ncbi:MAG TPA: hypothetical protein VFE11_10475 [Dongiaceae bacterium]|nr:hypothetical protein [Dongiaceae bacterium]